MNERDAEKLEAIKRAWTEVRVNSVWHKKNKNDVRKLMPELAKALDEATQGDND